MGPHRDQKIKKVRRTEVPRLKGSVYRTDTGRLRKCTLFAIKAGVLYHVYLVIYFNDVLLHFLISCFSRKPCEGYRTNLFLNCQI